MSRVLTVCVVFVLGCGEGTKPVCADTEIDGIGGECMGAGECALPLVCAERTCELPLTMTGVGGRSMTLQGAGGELAITVEVARSDLARTRGLSGRPCHQDGWGLLMIWPLAEIMSIETTLMRYDLDIAFLDELGVVRDVRREVPKGSGALYQPRDPALWVVEVPTGHLERIEVGWRATLK